ncbi:hypothetical protein H8356DRAFT_1348110 [Neocallimastix lanati (nom. inval.)]|nr:hypothetical protein H8356DRAFT_1348110 [Neocallimastix sp. JGI-2020a]
MQSGEMQFGDMPHTLNQVLYRLGYNGLASKNNNMQVRVPKLKYSARSSSKDNSTFMERKCVRGAKIKESNILFRIYPFPYGTMTYIYLVVILFFLNDTLLLWRSRLWFVIARVNDYFILKLQLKLLLSITTPPIATTNSKNAPFNNYYSKYNFYF